MRELEEGGLVCAKLTQLAQCFEEEYVAATVALSITNFLSSTRSLR